MLRIHTVCDAEGHGHDHAVGFWVARRAQTVLYAQRLAAQVELVSARRHAFLLVKRSVNWLPLSVSSLVIFIGAAWCNRLGKSTLLASLGLA